MKDSGLVRIKLVICHLQKVNHKIDVYRQASQAGSEAAVNCDVLPLKQTDALLQEVADYEEQHPLPE
ncbi:hypothetical protein N7X57_09545 [Lactiplantibacillus paraplantarum]|uniref:hypothetical protein n=1 Tax=Lactiplantibacillus paraplantarum TaxID=60520 RepID=UPI00222273BF|nr:hypothetical protein [Lactiplantibacillus paraplantarum]MCW1910669.1 hypothetical protein [Lactiplantibacillus paraplantarum]